LILNYWGPQRFAESQRTEPMVIVEEGYGVGSTRITSQLPVDAWHDIIDEPTFADAILDRFVPNAYRIQFDGQLHAQIC
jgi:DNA replication protein DnaC